MKRVLWVALALSFLASCTMEEPGNGELHPFSTGMSKLADKEAFGDEVPADTQPDETVVVSGTKTLPWHDAEDWPPSKTDPGSILNSFQKLADTAGNDSYVRIMIRDRYGICLPMRVVEQRKEIYSLSDAGVRCPKSVVEMTTVSVVLHDKHHSSDLGPKRLKEIEKLAKAYLNATKVYVGSGACYRSSSPKGIIPQLCTKPTPARKKACEEYCRGERPPATKVPCTDEMLRDNLIKNTKHVLDQQIPLRDTTPL